MPYLNTNKTLNFTLNLNKIDNKKDLNEKSMKQSSFNKNTHSVKSLNRFNLTSFEDYYTSVRQKNNNFKLLTKINKHL